LAGLPGAVTFVVELFHWRVLRHFLPVIAGFYLAYGAAISLVRRLYDLPDAAAARQLLGQLRASGGILERPILLSADNLEEVRDQLPLLRVGGPGLVKIVPGEVAVTEKNGRIFRVLPPGLYSLARFEYVHTILNLHEQERSIENIPLVTRDGIELNADVSLSFRISQGSDLPTRTKPFPYDEDAVKLAAYDQTVTSTGTSTWENSPVSTVRSEFKKIIAKYRLDEILQLEDSIDDPHFVIGSELERRTRLALMEKGINLVTLHVGRLKFPTAVTEQYIKYWQAHWEIQADLSRADGDARALEEVEVARAEAEVTMIQAIVEGVRRAQQDGHTGTVREIVAMRLIEAMEKVAKQSQNVESLPNNPIPRLTQYRRELLPPPVISKDMRE
jgi:regulator of protease activity HflC (stomatin/prohibitin superfamily)